LTTPTEDRVWLTALPARTFKPRRYRPGNLGAWSGHLQFAADLIAALKPSLLVELGTHYGESYFGMCQSVQESAASCMCYAVDTWQGDPHAGYYDESVFEEVNKYNDENYASFSKLLRTTFDRAVENFGDDTIDLLHIDGLHTYEAVRHDFDNWFPKVRPGGVVLFHDTAARHADFEVWRLWEELASVFSHFEFTHSWGLGVLVKPPSVADLPDFINGLVSAAPPEQAFLRHYYASQAMAIECAETVAVKPAQAMFQVFPGVSHEYTEGTSVRAPLERGTWHHVKLDLPQGSGTGRIRVDPADRPCVVQLAGIVLRRAVDESIVASWTEVAAVEGFTLVGDIVWVPGPEMQFLSTGNDARFLLPPLEEAVSDQPLIFEARVRILDDLGPAVATLQGSSETMTTGWGQYSVDIQTLRRDVEAMRIERASAITERDLATTRVQQVTAELHHLQAERVAAVADYRRVHAANESLANEAASLKIYAAKESKRCRRMEGEISQLRAQTRAMTKTLQRAEKKREQLASELKAALKSRHQLATQLKIVLKSKSWRLTAPLRRLVRTFR